MAELSKWDSEYEEMVLEHLTSLDKSVLVDWVVSMLSDGEVEQLIDDIEEGNR